MYTWIQYKEDKWWKKYIALLLCFALIFLLAPQTIAEPLLPKDTALSTADVTVNIENTAAQKTEVLSKRDAYSKTYVLPVWKVK